MCTESPQRKGCWHVPIDVAFHRLVPLVTSSKNNIPEASLLSIIVAVLPTLSVVQIMILSEQLRTEQLQQRRCCRWWRDPDPKTTVAP